MNTYSAAGFPTISVSTCGDPTCNLDICQGPESHGIKKPWYMIQKPIPDPKTIASDPVVLMKMDEWVLEKHREDSKESELFQYCPSTQWKKLLSITEIRAGMCDDCLETVPEEMVAAYTMHNWNALQKYDADMKQYGAGPWVAETESIVNIQVFR